MIDIQQGVSAVLPVSNTVAWIGFLSLLVPTVLAPIVQIFVGIYNRQKSDEVKTAVQLAGNTAVHFATEAANSAAQASAKLDQVHQLVDGQKGIILENLALSYEANVSDLRSHPDTTPERLATAVEAARAARKAADDHAETLKGAIQKGYKIIEEDPQGQAGGEKK